MNTYLYDLVVVIPCLNPDERLINHVKELMEVGFVNYVLVNDGSSAQYDLVFDTISDMISTINNCDNKNIVLKHSINLGVGRAYKTAFNYILDSFGAVKGVITCDADGQHKAKDVKKCAEEFLKDTDKLIIGVRNFDEKNVPFRSRFGNKCTSLSFRMFCGMDISDTQTGLRAISLKWLPFLMETKGERYEYCTSELLELNKQGCQIKEVCIETVYIDDNSSSHFNPLIDSLRIYSLLLKYMFSSLSAFIVDIVFFSLFISIFRKFSSSTYIVVSTALARIVSCTYSYFVNRNLVFQNKDAVTITAVRFIVLCIIQATLSGMLVTWFTMRLSVYEVIIKIVIDTILFFVSFEAQQKWVFKKKGA